MPRAHAATSDLDASFGSGGTVTTPIGFGQSFDHSVETLLPGNGRIIAVGQAGASSASFYGSFLEMARYNSNGSLDTAFGTGGKVRDLMPLSGYATCAALQTDGKILVGGYAYDYFGATPVQQFLLLRYNSNGTRDLSFGNEGYVVSTFGAFTSAIYGLAVRPDGRIIAAGSSSSGDYLDNFTVAQYNSDGSLDNGFGTGGVSITSLANGEGVYARDIINDIVLQGDGKIVAAGYSINPGSYYDIALARYNSDGSLDTAFGTGGKVITPVGTADGFDMAHAVATQPDGKVVVAGESFDSSVGSRFALLRYNGNGALDSAFGTAGAAFARSPGANDNRGQQLNIQTDGKLVVSGATRLTSNAESFMAARFEINGTLDGSFGTGGIASTAMGVGVDNSQANAGALQADGKLIISGYYCPSESVYDLALARYNGNGTLDTGFGKSGLVITDFGNKAGTDIANALALQSDGKIVAAGYAFAGKTNDFAVARYNANGTLDTTFGSAGIVTTPVGAGDDYAQGVAIQADGKIVAAGYSYSAGRSVIVFARYTISGALDTAFGSGGKVVTSVGGNDMVRCVAIQSDGKIVAAGTAITNRVGFGIVRLNPNGSLDTSFGGTGRVLTTMGSSTSQASALCIQNDKKIVVGGSSSSNQEDFALVRYNTNGTLDTTFGTGGIVTTPATTGGSSIRALALQSDGRIVAAGAAFSSSGNTFALARYDTNGALDASFGNGGKVSTSLGSYDDVIQGVAVQSDNKIIVCGRTVNMDRYDYDIALARYGPDGQLDAGFGVNGILTVDLSGSDQEANAIALDAGGRIVAAGYTFNADTLDDFALLRCLKDAPQTGAAMVVNTSDDHDDGACTRGDCTLREAINFANNNAGTTIGFKIPTTDPNYNNPPEQDTAGVFTITPRAPLPAIAAAGTTIDGFSQPGSITNATRNVAPVLKIQLSGASAGAGDGLVVQADDCTLRGVIVNRWSGAGMRLVGNSNNVAGCIVGTDATTTMPLPNGVGIVIEGGSNRVGDGHSNTANTIAKNSGAGVRVLTGNGNSLRDNSIFENGALGIDLAGGSQSPAGVTSNDSGDSDAGANDLQNFPVLTRASSTSAGIAFSGTLNSKPGTRYSIDFYLSPTSDASGNGEGRIYLGNSTVTTDGSGNASFTDVSFNGAFGAPAFVSATATDASDNTSEFSGAIIALLEISGRVTDNGTDGVAGVAIKRSGSTLTYTTDFSGNYSIPVAPGTHTITPLLGGFTFSPASRSVTVQSMAVGGQDFQRRYAISGRIASSDGAALGNIQVRVNTGASATTNSAGYYTLSGLAAGTYTITPTSSVYGFNPGSRIVILTNNNIGGQNFTAGVPYTVSGRISTSGGTGIPNVAVVRSGTATPLYTNSAGYFTFTGVIPGTYAITPSLAGYGFSPTSRTVTVSSSNIAGQNFLGSPP